MNVAQQLFDLNVKLNTQIKERLGRIYDLEKTYVRFTGTSLYRGSLRPKYFCLKWHTQADVFYFHPVSTDSIAICWLDDDKDMNTFEVSSLFFEDFETFFRMHAEELFDVNAQERAKYDAYLVALEAEKAFKESIQQMCEAPENAEEFELYKRLKAKYEGVSHAE